MGSIKIFIMSASTDLNTLKQRVEVLEAELDRSKIDFDYSVDLVQEYKDQCDELRDRYTALKLENKCLTRKLNEPNAHCSFPTIASQSDEVAPLRQQLAEKDQVIAAQDEKYHSLLNSIKPLFNTLFAFSSRLNKESIQSCLAAMPKDAARTLETLQNELAQGGPPSDGNADSKTLVNQRATKTPSERPASRSKRPDLEQQLEPSTKEPVSYSGIVTSKRADLPRRGRAGQAKVPVPHEVIARSEARGAEKREDIQSSAGRSEKPNKVGGFQPSQIAAGSTNITAPPAPKQDITGSQLPKDPHGASFAAKEETRSSPIPVAGSPLFKNWGASFVVKEKTRSYPIPEEKVADSPLPKKPHRASFVANEEPPSSSVPKEKVVQ